MDEHRRWLVQTYTAAGCDKEGELRKIALDLSEMKPGETLPWAKHVKATLCDEHHESVRHSPANYFPNRVTTTL